MNILLPSTNATFIVESYQWQYSKLNLLIALTLLPKTHMSTPSFWSLPVGLTNFPLQATLSLWPSKLIYSCLLQSLKIISLCPFHHHLFLLTPFTFIQFYWPHPCLVIHQLLHISSNFINLAHRTTDTLASNKHEIHHHNILSHIVLWDNHYHSHSFNIIHNPFEKFLGLQKLILANVVCI